MSTPVAALQHYAAGTTRKRDKPRARPYKAAKSNP